MIRDIASTLFFGQPLFLIVGLKAFVLFLLAAVVGRLNYKGVKGISFKWHPILVALAMIVALIHMILALSVFFNF